MTARASILEGELAAYSPGELSELVETVSLLLDAADDGSTGFCVAHARIQSTLIQAVEARMIDERKAGQTAIIVPFPGRSQMRGQPDRG